MENIELKQSFLVNWERFTDELKGSLVRYSANQPLTSSSASQILADLLFEWKSEANLIGRWLDNLKTTDSVKAAKVSELLFTKVKFEEVKQEPGKMITLLPYAPFAVSAVAFAITYLIQKKQEMQIDTEASIALQAIIDSFFWWKVAAAVVPIIVLYSPIKKLQNRLILDNTQNTIPSYLAQLDKYKEAILSIL